MAGCSQSIGGLDHSSARILAPGCRADSVAAAPMARTGTRLSNLAAGSAAIRPAPIRAAAASTPAVARLNAGLRLGARPAVLRARVSAASRLPAKAKYAWLRIAVRA